MEIPWIDKLSNKPHCIIKINFVRFTDLLIFAMRTDGIYASIKTTRSFFLR